MAGKVKKLFPGGNTGYGFHSFYDYIIAPNANYIFVIKGGPGVGKSTFMRWIGQQLVERGFDIEEHHCSSDNGSLDGVKIPSIGVALIDGTAPHIVDPKHPGAVDTIIHLGDYWNEAGMRQNKQNVLDSTATVSMCFKRAYGYLRAAKNYNDELEAYIRDTKALDIAGLNRVAADIKSCIFDKVPVKATAPSERHLFGSAITPKGCVNYLSTIVGDLKWRVLLHGRPGTGRTTIVEKVMRDALERGYDVEAYHCALDPQRIDHVVIPELSVAIMNATEPHGSTAAPGDLIIDTMDYVDIEKLVPWDYDICRLNQRYHEALDSGVSLIARAKKTHDVLETSFVPNMDFDAVTIRRNQTLARILELADEVKAQAANNDN